jgi:hypothetical protein
MVFGWDDSFTIEKMENFFKIVLKNAVKRKAMKNLRASGKRTRKTATNTNAAQPPQGNPSNEVMNELNENFNVNENHDVANADLVENMEDDDEESNLR